MFPFQSVTFDVMSEQTDGLYSPLRAKSPLSDKQNKPMGIGE